MKRAVLIPLLLAACQPVDFDFDLDLSGLEPGPIHGEYDAVTFSLVDGCPDGNFLFGCPKTMPPFAIGSRARLVIGSTSGVPEDDERLANAIFKTSNARAVSVARDADGFVVIEGLAEGVSDVEIDDADGTLIDAVRIEVEPIVRLEGDTSTMILEGARLAAGVLATGSSGRHLFAHGAVVATLSGIDLDSDPSGFFNRSDQVVIRTERVTAPDTGGETQPTEAIASRRSAHITWSASSGSVETSVAYSIVERDDITSAKVAELWHDPGAYKQTLNADVKVGDTYVRGGPACEWRVVSGGGDGAAIATGAGDDTHSDWAFFNLALVYGEGDTTIECRVNNRVAEQLTVHLGP
ncbi:MAG TPA: hypothetical protein VL326_15930 [Kofleriaceae bacterium]|jgi:hypothetical protein|nr:hypothetical protein [Kofleriaceae bacterium]